MADQFLVLPSPLLGQVAYEPFVQALNQHGSVHVLSRGEPQTGTSLATQWAREFPEYGNSCVAVAHSNAGYLAPLVRELTGISFPIVFMDAALPGSDGDIRLAPQELLDHLHPLVDADGVLPPWTRWWVKADLEGLTPPGWLDRIDRSCPQVPLAYLESTVSATRGWVDKPAAYLAFGDTYAEEYAFAISRGWPTVQMAGGHLHFLCQPEETAQAVFELSIKASRGSER